MLNPYNPDALERVNELVELIPQHALSILQAAIANMDFTVAVEELDIFFGKLK